MKLSQLQHWTKADTGGVPQCILTRYAGGTDYLVEIEYKHHLEPLRDDAGEVIKFQSIEQAKNRLQPLGISSVILRMIDPYEEFASTDTPSSSVEDMIIPL